VSDNEENPSTTPGPKGPVATDGSDRTDVPPLPTDGAAEVPSDAAEIAEDRTTPANGATTASAAAGGTASNGSGVSSVPSSSSPSPSGSAGSAASSASSAEAAATSNGSSASPPAAHETAVFARPETPSPVPRPRPDAASSASSVPAEEPVTETFQPGSVPTPPPWRRASGSEVSESSAATAASAAAATAPPRRASRQAPVDSLLSEAPTAYFDRGAVPGSGHASLGGHQADVHAEVPAVGERAPRQALLQLKRFDPWSVLKLALVLAVVLFFIWLVAVGVLYGVLDGMGVWDRLNGTYADLVSGGAEGGGGSLISAGSVFGIAAVIGAVNSLLFAVAMTVGAFVYNVSADLVGGVEVTLSERD